MLFRSVSAGKANTNSNYASVNEQAGLFAANGGYQVNVAGNTNLTAAVMASSEMAAHRVDANGKPINQLNTQTLTVSNIENTAEYSATGSSFSAGVGSQKGASAGNSNLSDDSNSVTVSAISAGTVNITNNTAQTANTGKDAVTTVANINRDVQTSLQTTEDGRQIATAVDSSGNNLAGTLTPIFDQAQIQRELQAQVQITQAFSQVAPKAVGDYAQTQYDKYIAEGNLAEAAKWDDGGIYRVALHTLVGGLSGNLEGAIGAGTSAATIPKIAEKIKALNIPTELKDALILATAGAIGSATGGTTGAGAALSETGNNYLKHAELAAFAKELAQCKANKSCNEYDIYQKYQTISNQNNAELVAAYEAGDYLKLSVINKDMLLSRNSLNKIDQVFGADWQTKTKFDETYNAWYGLTPTQSKEFGEDARLYANFALLEVTLDMQKAGISPEEQKRNLALLLDLTPALGSGKALIELITGKDPITEQDASRLWALVGVVTSGPVGSLIKEAKIALQAGDMVKATAKLNEAKVLVEIAASEKALANIVSNIPANSTVKGFLNGTKLEATGAKIAMGDLSATQQALVKDIVANADTAGTKTESLISSILKDAGYTELEGAKYAGNKGFDHVVKSLDGTVTIILDSKQIAKSGSVKLGVSSEITQLSEEAIKAVLDNLPEGLAKVAIENALKNGSLKTAVAGVDKVTKQVVVAPVLVPPRGF